MIKNTFRANLLPAIINKTAAKVWFRDLATAFVITGLVACGGGAGSKSGGGGGGGASGGDTPVNGGGLNPSGDAPAASGNSGDESLTGGDGTGGGGSVNGGAGGGGGGDGGISVNPGTGAGTQRAIVNYNGTPDEDGAVDVEFAVANTTSFHIVSQAPGLFIETRRLTSPSGAVVLDSNDNSPPRTTGLLFRFPVNFAVNPLPYPSNGSDPSVVAGKYTQRLLISAAGSDGSFTGTIIAKNDPNLNSGLLRLNFFLVGTKAQSREVRDILEDAIQNIVQNVYDSITVSISTQFVDVGSSSGVVPDPFGGSNFYAAQSTRAGIQSPAVNVFIADDVSFQDTTDPADGSGVLGIAAAIPGPPIGTARSAVAISILQHEGIDGALDPAEAQLFGETIAHEAGHFLGLFHPVECAAAGCSVLVEGDRLGGTPNCSTIGECISNGAVRNLMFPTPVAGVASQQSLSSDQGEVVQLQALVD